jgi:hypothetical protein
MGDLRSLFLRVWAEYSRAHARTGPGGNSILPAGIIDLSAFDIAAPKIRDSHPETRQVIANRIITPSRTAMAVPNFLEHSLRCP